LLNAQRLPRSVPAAALVAGAAGAGIAVVSSLYGGVTLALVALLAAVLAAPIVWKWARSELDFFEPLTIFCGSALVYWVGKALYIVLRNYGVEEYFPWPEERIEYLNMALIYATAGTLLMFVGYFGLPLPKRASAQPNSEIWSGRRVYGFVAIFIVTGILAIGYIVYSAGGPLRYLAMLPARGQMFEGKGYLMFLSQWPSAGLLLLYTHFAGRQRVPRSFWAVFALVVLVSASQGGRAAILKPILAMMAVAHYIRKPIRGRQLLVAFCIVVLFVLAGNYLRQMGEEYQTAGFWDRVYSRGDFDTMDSFMVTLKNVPSVVPYQLGMTYLAVAVGPIPRAVFQGKPYGAAGVYTSRLYPSFWDSHCTFSPGILGELYMNFGGAGILLGMLVYGAVLRWVYALFAPHNRATKPSLVLIYAMAIPFFFGAQMDFFTVAQTSLYVLAPALIGLKYCAKPLRIGGIRQGKS